MGNIIYLTEKQTIYTMLKMHSFQRTFETFGKIDKWEHVKNTEQKKTFDQERQKYYCFFLHLFINRHKPGLKKSSFL